MAEYFYGLKFGEIQQYNEMVVLPVCSGNEGSTKYLTLKEAMDENLIEITEVDDSGDVPELKVKNFADLPVLILDGEELVGAKQNRIVNTTMLLTEKFETLIPVSCVEQGRWSYTTKNFTDSNRLASYQLRNVKLASVKNPSKTLVSIHLTNAWYGMKSEHSRIKMPYIHLQVQCPMSTRLNLMI